MPRALACVAELGQQLGTQPGVGRLGDPTLEPRDGILVAAVGGGCPGRRQQERGDPLLAAGWGGQQVGHRRLGALAGPGPGAGHPAVDRVASRAVGAARDFAPRQPGAGRMGSAVASTPAATSASAAAAASAGSSSAASATSHSGASWPTTATVRARQAASGVTPDTIVSGPQSPGSTLATVRPTVAQD